MNCNLWNKILSLSLILIFRLGHTYIRDGYWKYLYLLIASLKLFWCRSTSLNIMAWYILISWQTEFGAKANILLYLLLLQLLYSIFFLLFLVYILFQTIKKDYTLAFKFSWSSVSFVKQLYVHLNFQIWSFLFQDFFY